MGCWVFPVAAMPDETLPALLEETARRHPDAPALAGLRDSGVRWSLSWSGLRARVRGFAAKLLERGLEAGDAAAVWGEDPSPRWILASLALHEVGVAEVPLRPGLPADQARLVVDAAGASAAVAGPGDDRPEALAGAGLDPVLGWDEVPETGVPGSAPAGDRDLPEAAPSSPALLLATGWGEATDVVTVEAGELAAGVAAAREALPVDRGDRVLQAAAPTHVPARVAGTLAPLAAGASVAVVGDVAGRPGLEAGERLLATARDLGSTAVCAGAEAATDAWRGVHGAGEALETVLAAGDPLPVGARAGLAEAGLDLVEVLGPGEAGPVVAVDVGEGPGPLPGLEVRERGDELEVRGPGVPLDRAGDDGWAPTGWTGDVDPASGIEVGGRLADRLPGKEGGVPAEAVERSLRGTSPAVARALAVEVVDGAGAVLVPDPVAGSGEEELVEAARRAEQGPDRVAVLEEGWEEATRDHAGEVRREASVEVWGDRLEWRSL